MIRYMIIDRETHRDDCFEFFKDLHQALTRADELYHAACDHYGIPLQERWNQACDIKRSWDGRTYYCGRSPCDSFSVTVEEVEVPE